MILDFLGTRGSISVSGRDFFRYGGLTSCYVLDPNSEEPIIIDAGTGICNMNFKPNAKKFHIFLTHMHWDHCIGLTLFPPIFQDTEINIYYKSSLLPNSNLITELFRAPFFPVNSDALLSKINIINIEEFENISILDYNIKYIDGNHPDGSTMYRISKNNISVTFTGDYEHGYIDDKLIEFANDSDCLVYDATYTSNDFIAGFGHSTYEKGLEIASRAHVGNIIFTHHNNTTTDDSLNIINSGLKSSLTQQNFIIAYDNMRIEIK